MTYEDPQAVKGLASALDVRKQNTGGVGHGSVFCYPRGIQAVGGCFDRASHSVFQQRGSNGYFEIDILEQVLAQ